MGVLVEHSSGTGQNGKKQTRTLIMASKADPYAGIEFEEINEATGLEVDEIKCLKNCFDLFDAKKQDFLSADDLDEILRAMGFRPSKEELMDILAEIDEDGSGEIEFAEFCQLCAKFLVEDPDIDTMKRELKDAFRIYDKNGEGFITMDVLRALIAELLAPLTDEELDGIIAELDDDESARKLTNLSTLSTILHISIIRIFSYNRILSFGISKHKIMFGVSPIILLL